MDTFKALVVRENNGDVSYQVEEHTKKDMLDDGEVLIKVAYSSVNYKDMLAVQKNGGVIRNYPMIPGIDFVEPLKSLQILIILKGSKF